MKTALALILALILSALPAASQCPLGYTSGVGNLTRTPWGFSYQDLVAAQKSHGINVTMTMVFFAPDYTILRDSLPSIVNGWSGVDVVLDFSSVLFKPRTGSFDCSSYGGGTQPAQYALYHAGDAYNPSNGDPGGHWQTRVANIDAAVGNFIRANVDYLVVHAEVNNSCIPEWQVAVAADELRARFPGIPLIAGYPTRADHPGTKGFPSLFPWNVDIIATWAYGVYAPLQPASPNNVDKIHYSGGFYNPANPLSLSTGWGDLVSRLRGPWNGGVKQSVFPVMESFFGNRQSVRGWTTTTLANANANWYRWARVTNFKHADGVTSLTMMPVMAFLWQDFDNIQNMQESFQGVESLSTVRAKHRDLSRCIY